MKRVVKGIGIPHLLVLRMTVAMRGYRRWPVWVFLWYSDWSVRRVETRELGQYGLTHGDWQPLLKLQVLAVVVLWLRLCLSLRCVYTLVSGLHAGRGAEYNRLCV